MKLALITLGAREIQLDREALEAGFESLTVETEGNFARISAPSGTNLEFRVDANLGTYVPNSARALGQELVEFEEWKELRDQVSYPLVYAFVSRLAQTETLPERFWFVATHQNPEDKHDTYYSAQLIAHFLNRDFDIDPRHVEIVTVKDRVAELDHQYLQFVALKELLKQSQPGITEVILFLQGGIGAINSALLLRCLENDHLKVRSFRLSERKEQDSNDRAANTASAVMEDQFPAHFQKTLFKERSLALLENGEYETLYTSTKKYEDLKPYTQLLSNLERLDFEAIAKNGKALSLRLNQTNLNLGKQLKQSFDSPHRHTYWLGCMLTENIRLRKLPKILYQSVQLQELLQRSWIMKVAQIEHFNQESLNGFIARKGLSHVDINKNDGVRKLMEEIRLKLKHQQDATLKNLLKELQRLKNKRNAFLHQGSHINDGGLENLQALDTSIKAYFTHHALPVQPDLLESLKIQVRHQITKQ